MSAGTLHRIRAALVLEDGAVFRGFALGSQGRTAGELVFNTSFCGYQEILTDPSYRRQIICMAFPMMGNYGFAEAHCESPTVQAAGFVVADAMPVPAGANAENLDAYLRRHGIVGIQGVDTRAIVRRVRDRGAMRAILTTRDEDLERIETVVAEARALPSMAGADLVRELPARREVFNPGGRLPIALLDCGAKRGILEALARRDCRVEIFPATATVDEILEAGPAGLQLSNGPGDPEPLAGVIATVRALIGKLPIFGICLGHQILALAAGARTYKLPFGHRGSNHPVLDHATQKIVITSQNHGFAVDVQSLPTGVEATETNLYDGTNEGIAIKAKRAFSVQYHPEASPGPLEAAERFDRFLGMIKDGRQ